MGPKNGKPPEGRDKPRRLTPQAERALAEAQARRARAKEEAREKEVNGPAGPEPTRFGDWERKGIVSDF